METAGVRAVLFVKDLERVAAFYVGALALTRLSGDKDHAVLECDGFELVVHQIPKQIADTIVIAQPPIRRVWGAIRLDFPVASIADSRKLARSLGGEIDDAPPPWADRTANLIFRPRPGGQSTRRQPTQVARQSDERVMRYERGDDPAAHRRRHLPGLRVEPARRGRALASPVTNNHASFYTARRKMSFLDARVAELVDAADSDNTN